MRTSRSLLVIACCLAALAALPAGANAKPGYYVSKPSLFSVLDVRGSHGYRITVLGLGKEVSILAYKGGVSASYTVPGKITDERIKARFGNRGRVSLRLQPTEPLEEEDEAGCRGKAPTTQRGVFRGTIRFRGEEGFTEARATRARGFVFHTYRQVCKRRGSEPSWPKLSEIPASSLSAVSNRGPRTPWFSAFKEEPAKPRNFFSSLEEANYTAASTEWRGRMAVYRSASVTAPPETFTVTPPGTRPAAATVDPPPPFRGSATYERGPGGTALWSGDLRVELPGLGEVPLTDSSYRAKLCRSLACACPVGYCAFVISTSSQRQRAARLRQLAYGSGSHSQPLALARLSSLR